MLYYCKYYITDVHNTIFNNYETEQPTFIKFIYAESTYAVII
jgi:hypothetical protein